MSHARHHYSPCNPRPRHSNTLQNESQIIFTSIHSGLPSCCVSIGFCLDQKPLMGVVYAPMTDELYIGVVGYGAFRNGNKIMPAKKETPLKEAVVCFEFGYVRGRKEVASMVSVVENIMAYGCRATRQIGSGVLDLCYVATGRLDVVYAGVAGDGWKPWDLCAGYVIAREAGCVMESFQQSEQGDFDLYSQNHICATNKVLLEVRKMGDFQLRLPLPLFVDSCTLVVLCFSFRTFEHLSRMNGTNLRRKINKLVKMELFSKLCSNTE